MNVQAGREIVTDARLALTLPIVNLPFDAKIRIRIRQGYRFPYFYVRTDEGLRKCMGLFIAGRSAIELVQLAANLNRQPIIGDTFTTVPTTNVPVPGCNCPDCMPRSTGDPA